MRNKNEFAKTPPRGWNSYDYYNTAVTEEEVKRTADYMASHLLPYGYEYVVIDIEWYANDADTDDRYQYLPFGNNEMDAYGRFQPSPKRFPSSADGSGFTKLAAYVHEKGLKFGIHILRGIPREAAHRHLPLYDSTATAADIADPASICGWNPDMYGVRNTPEGQHYYDTLIQMYADWGVDFIKCDDICDSWTYRPSNHNPFLGWEETRMLHRAIMKCGRPIVLSLSPGPAQLPRAWEYAHNANMWRITDDFWDDWSLLKPMFERCEVWQNHVSPGCYPDCDMLPVGKLGGRFPGHPERQTNFSKEEQKTMMSLWCLFGAPLMIGADLLSLDPDTLSLLTNREILSLDDGKHRGVQVKRSGTEAVWASMGEDKSLVLGLFNLGDSDAQIRTDLSDLAEADVDAEAVPDGTSFRELWGEAPAVFAGGIGAMVPAHGVRVFRIL